MRKCFYTSVILISIILLFITFTNSIKHNLYSGSFHTTRLVNTILPQGWGFFTKDPREANVYCYKYNNGNLENMIYTSDHYVNLFGLSKKSRMIAFENSMILGQIKKIPYQSINNLKNDHAIYKVKCNGLNYLKEGEYIIIRDEVPPYLWRDFKKKEKTFIHVRCIKN
ncbi:SdpA family antimicrobial peptide system protein [Elizabethkingia argentiflava]|uniref:SdpA family antimicrobial peptide system protein n=1 Tax=Elizabethkingia argenteiflava TaxID=2681556 RepID=A0A845PTW9_9FLAO|nr:SdpA family antimicrobial peptide system protein [Elizabethkingia argenteiflava]